MTILVTGATGLVGNNVVRLLRERGDAVRVLQREGSDPRPLAGLDVEVARGDIRDADAVHRACQGVQGVVHSAGYVHIGWSKPELFQAINVEGTRHVVDGALAAGAKLVQVSSVDALGFHKNGTPADEETPPDPNDRIPYAVSKREAEQVVLAGVERGLDASIVNPTYMIGPWDWKPSSGRLLLRVSKGGVLLTPRGSNDFCDVRDVAAGILAALERGQPGRRYILGGEPLSYLQAIRIFADVTGRWPPLCKAGPLQILVAGWFQTALGKLTGRERDINRAAVKISFQHRHFSYARAAQELDYHPRPLREAAVAAWDWFREHGYA